MVIEEMSRGFRALSVGEARLETRNIERTESWVKCMMIKEFSEGQELKE